MKTKEIRSSRCRFTMLAFYAAIASTVAAPASAQTPAEPTLDVARYRVEGHSPLSESEMNAALAPFVGEKRTIGQIEQAARALEKAMHDKGYVFYRAFVPVQKPENGEVRLQLIVFKLGEVSVSGNENFSADNIRRSLPALRPGEAPDMFELGRDLTAANANPSKQASVTFREGSARETVDADVRVKDADPLNYFASYTANRSVDPMNRGDNIYRLAVGIQHANLFDRDHVATLSYTTDPRDLGKLSLFGAYYQLPFYGTGLSLSAYYTHSDVNSGVVPQGGGAFNVSGRGNFFGLRLTQALPRVGNMQHTASLAIDDRYFEHGTRATGTGERLLENVGSRPLSLRYAAHQDEPWGGYGGSLERAINIGGGAADRGFRYAQNGGDFGWQAWRFTGDISLRNWGWNFAAQLKGQWSPYKLISEEQFGLGGPGSVRGLADREVSGDSGYSWSLEATAPVVLLPQMKPVLFLDGGYVVNHDPSSRSLEFKRENVLSAGAGLRWTYQQLQTSLDLAHVFDRNNINPDNIRNRVHLSLFYRF